MARQVFGSYRRDEFADPDSFLVQLGMVLERYSDDVVAYVTHPYTGIQRRCKFPPSMAEVCEAADAEAAAIATRRRYAAMGTRTERQCRSLTLSEMPAGHLANTLVRPTVPGYQEMVERARNATAPYFRHAAEGIWVPYSWVDDWRSAGGGVSARRINMADVDAMFAAHDAAEAAAE